MTFDQPPADRRLLKVLDALLAQRRG